MESTFDGLVTVTEDDSFAGPGTPDLNSIDWTPDGVYVVAGGDTNSNGDNLVLYKYDYENNRLDLLQYLSNGAEVQWVQWSPDGSFLATVGSPDSTVSFRIYELDRVNEQLILLQSLTLDSGVRSDGVDWTSDGRFIGVANNNSTTEVKLYEFDPLTKQATFRDGVPVTTVSATRGSWSGDLFAITTRTNIAFRIYKLDRGTKTITEVDFASTPGGITVTAILAIAWSPNGKYLAVGGDTDPDSDSPILVYEIDRENNTNTLVAQLTLGAIIRDINWITDNLFALSVDLTGENLKVFEFNGVDAITELASAGHANVIAPGIRWSPDGQLLACVDSDGIVLMVSGLQFPGKNVIQNNKVYCNSGNSTSGGVGISGSSILNLIIGNTAFDNPFNYQFVTNIFNQLFGDEPTALQNVSLNSTNPIAKRIDLPTELCRLERLAESLIENLL